MALAHNGAMGKKKKKREDKKGKKKPERKKNARGPQTALITLPQPSMPWAVPGDKSGE